MLRLTLLVNAGALMALAQMSVGLWPQIAITPPGTNETQRTEVLTGTQGGGVTAVVGGGVVGVPLPTQQTTTGGATGVPSIVTGPAGTATGGISQGPNSVSGGTVAPLQSSASQCDVKLTTTRATVGPHGGPVEIAIAPLPAQCNPTLGASGTWLQLASNGIAADIYRFSAAPNTSPIARTANVVIGNQVFLVEQEGLIRTRLAAAPAKIAIGLHPKYTEHKRQISLWADKPGVMLAVAANAPWIRVEARRSRRPDTRTFEVVVDSEKLPEGVRHEGAVIVSADGAPPLSVPVVVERISRR